MAFRWIHLSDFHFTASDPYDRNTVLKALLVEIERRHQIDFHADALFVTGDIAYSGQANEYQQATTFFDALLKNAGVDKKRLFVVPGNHDVDKKAGSGLDRTLGEEQQSVEYFSDRSPKEHFNKFKAFRDWFDGYFNGIRSCPVDSTCHEPCVLNAKSMRVVVMPLNTALFSMPDGKDHNSLWLGRRNFDAMLDKLETLNPDLTIALLHHPLDWLHDAERTIIETLLQERADIILRGHLHENKVSSIATIHSSLVHMLVGACYQTRKYPNTALFCTADLDSRKLEVEPIRYADSPKPVWTSDTPLSFQFKRILHRFPASG